MHTDDDYFTRKASEIAETRARLDDLFAKERCEERNGDVVEFGHSLRSVSDSLRAEAKAMREQAMLLIDQSKEAQRYSSAVFRRQAQKTR